MDHLVSPADQFSGATQMHGNENQLPDFLPHAELEAIREVRWRKIVAEAYARSPFYRQHLGQHFGAHGISSVDQLQSIMQLPTIDSHDVLKLSELIALEGGRIADVYCSGGTSQTPKIILRSCEDMYISAEAAVRMFKCGGVATYDTVMILQPFGIWAIGSIAFSAFTSMGCRVLPVGAGIPEEITSMLCSQFAPSVIYTSPRYARELTRRFKEMGLDCRSLGVRLFLLAGEGFGRGTRDFLAWEWGADTVDIYGSEETDGLGAECPFHRGLHLLEDEFFFEVLSLDAEVSNEDGLIGELVLTTLTKDVYPLIRYRTGDIVQLLAGQCECGRTSRRIRIIGRNDLTP